MRAGSAVVLASSQSMTVRASAMSSGPAVSIWPPEVQKPRVVYETHGVAALGQVYGLGQVLQVVEAPAVDEDDRGVLPGRRGFDHVGLEDDTVGGA